MTNEPRDPEPTEPIRPLGDFSWQQAPGSPDAPTPPTPAPTWQWTPAEPLPRISGGAASGPCDDASYPAGASGGPGLGASYPAAASGGPGLGASYPAAASRSSFGAPYVASSRNHVSPRAKALGIAAAFVLTGASAAGGVAFAYSHANESSSAAGIASGGTLLPRQDAQGQPPSTGPSVAPPTGGSQSPRHPGGRPSSITLPGEATPSQQVGVVDINTRLRFLGARAAGTGMILTSDGEILTNNHVVEGATRIRVTVVSTGDRYVASVVGTDKVDDIAILQLSDASGLSVVTPNTRPVSIGDPVVAVGNALGDGGVPSAAKGKVTGINRTITTRSETGVEGERLRGMIEVDAHVISGESGGPLYDADGHVIGMDTAASASPTESIGFAIPIARALSIADRIESGESSDRIVQGTPAFLGVQFEQASASGGSGAVISGVLPKTPAAEAGLIRGDTITAVDGTTITSGTQLKTVLSHYQPDQSVSLTWIDTQGGTRTTTVTLMAGPAA